MSISKYPDEDSTWFHLDFKTRSYCANEQIGPLLNDTVFNDTMKVSQYYQIKYCPEKIMNDSSVAAVYSSLQRGIVAYTTKEGEQWIRVK